MSILNGSREYQGRKRAATREQYDRSRQVILEEIKEMLEAKTRPDINISPVPPRRDPSDWNPFD